MIGSEHPQGCDTEILLIWIHSRSLNAAVAVRIHSVIPEKERVSVYCHPRHSRRIYRQLYRWRPPDSETGLAMPTMGVSSWAVEAEKAVQLMAEKTPLGVVLKSLDWVLYAAFDGRGGNEYIPLFH